MEALHFTKVTPELRLDTPCPTAIPVTSKFVKGPVDVRVTSDISDSVLLSPLLPPIATIEEALANEDISAPLALISDPPTYHSDQLLPHVVPPSKYPTFAHPYLFRTAKTTIRVLDAFTGIYTIYHIGQIALYIVTNGRMRTGRFNPHLIPAGYLDFARRFNASNPSPKRFALYDYNNNSIRFEGPDITFEDFNIDLNLIGWRNYKPDIPRLRNAPYLQRRALADILDEIKKIDPNFKVPDSVNHSFRAENSNWRTNRSRDPRPRKSTTPPLTCRSPLTKPRDDDDHNSNASVMTI
ncbi:hypothetical protein CVT26_008806 [Gymnopilus dilepis]|uniref:Uncharacterized protein n=1 Tax=Gymnopilus dilepis TaxID=231916 RepID=A0A409X6W9_9AGAR|nr:hypothetical protein CVT26_008806 [Gymnopilus dilepis]